MQKELYVSIRMKSVVEREAGSELGECLGIERVQYLLLWLAGHHKYERQTSFLDDAGQNFQ